MARDRSSETTRRLLLSAAFQEIHRNGFRATSVDDILAETGMTKGALYHHFPNKMALGYAVVDELLIPATRQMWLDPVLGAEDPIEAMVGTLRDAVVGQPGKNVELGCPVANLALEMSPVDDGFRDRIQRLYDLWIESYADVLERARLRGRARADIDPVSTARFIVASIEGCFTVAKNAHSCEVMRTCFDRLADYIRTLKA